MPSPEKDRPSGRRLGRLLAALRPSRAGPLPVQTGFPTSLADLVVKNHGRLKKQPSPSSKRRKPPPSSPPPPPPAAAVAPPRPDLSPTRAVRREKLGGFGLGLGFLAISGVVSLALLVIWSKKVVAAVTVASFSLFLLESLRCSSSLPRRWRRVSAATERQLYLDGRGRVSPIREVEAETGSSRRLSCSDSDRGPIEATILADAEEKSGGMCDESSDAKGKTKRRSWKKLIASAKKLHKGRKSNKEPEDFSGSFRSEGGRSDATTKEEQVAEEEQGKAAGLRLPALVLVAVVLVGLVAGKLPAVAFTMLCAAFFGSVPRFPCRGDGSRWRRLEFPSRVVGTSL
ncbi:hypothetical protein PR202_ga12902 [Eleusine coracana subsp. coracana]|uniref:Uncharacterized protein n=1 Tax=Eleusine coracana subsp. coracana TaxID=191504 RepID=A0AAV5CCW3_ELECO|nr:hypothetical protein PR202_ga12902 [Eleusine coracana subsp. coracana]